VKAGGGLLSIVRTAREGDKPWRRSSSSTGRIYGLTRSSFSARTSAPQKHDILTTLLRLI
jgi:hypothetical protein